MKKWFFNLSSKVRDKRAQRKGGAKQAHTSTDAHVKELPAQNIVNEPETITTQTIAVPQSSNNAENPNCAEIEEKERLAKCKYDLVVIDFETTGLKSPYETILNGGKFDEVLSVSIIDQDGNTLLDTLCKPEMRKTWTKSQEIHGISPTMVKYKPTFCDVFPIVKDILLNAKLVMAYNIDFELKFLYGYDAYLDFPGGDKLCDKIVWSPDPMLMYCAYRGNDRWQKLSAAAKHFKFDFSAHDSLSDVKATLYCYNKLLDYVQKNTDKDYIIKYGYLYDLGIKGKWIDLFTYQIQNDVPIKKQY